MPEQLSKSESVQPSKNKTKSSSFQTPKQSPSKNTETVSFKDEQSISKTPNQKTRGSLDQLLQQPETANDLPPQQQEEPKSDNEKPLESILKDNNSLINADIVLEELDKVGKHLTMEPSKTSVNDKENQQDSQGSLTNKMGDLMISNKKEGTKQSIAYKTKKMLGLGKPKGPRV